MCRIVICNNRQNSLSFAVHIQANLEDELVKEALRTVREAHHSADTPKLQYHSRVYK